MRYILEYVNMPDDTLYPGAREFVSMETLLAVVVQNYRGWTSVGVTVLPPRTI